MKLGTQYFVLELCISSANWKIFVTDSKLVEGECFQFRIQPFGQLIFVCVPGSKLD